MGQNPGWQPPWWLREFLGPYTGQSTSNAAPTSLAPPVVSPSPSGGPGPFGGGGTAQPSATPSDPNAPTETDVPPDYEAAVMAKLRAMIGTKGNLVPDSDLKAIADKMWQSVSLQQIWNQAKLTPSLMPSFETQVQALLFNPSLDPSVDPTIFTDYATAKQSVGESLSTAELAALSNVTMAANASVPRPFDTSQISGYDFGAPLPAGLAKTAGIGYQNGIDYGTPAGSRIVSPFAGTVTVQTGVQGYGNIVYVTLDNGWRIGFGHVAQGMATSGTRVNPGDLIALSGANVGDSTGAVTIVTWQSPTDIKKGTFSDPHEIMDPIFGGTTFAGLPGGQMAGAAGTGSSTVNTVLDREYPTIKSDWQAYFGTPPSPEDVYNVVAHGTSPTQWSDYIRSLPGHIDGMTVGQIYDLRTMADTVSQTALGHASTDGIVKELHDQGATGQQQVKLWYDEHSPNEIDRTTYTQIYQANQSTMNNVLNDTGFDPRIAQKQFQAQQVKAEGTV